MNTAIRLNKLRGLLDEKGLDAVLVSGAQNRRYLSGFTGSAGYLLISPTDAVLATDFRYVEQAGRQAPNFRVERITSKLDWFVKLASELEAGRVGFEDHHMTVGTHADFRKAVRDAGNGGRPALVGVSDLVDRMRATKDVEETEVLVRSIEITDQAFEQVAPTVVAGVTEREVAWELEKAMRERGAEGLAFDTIVGAGPNGALPHHQPDGTVLVEGQPVVIDMGAMHDGYCADLTRTIIVGKPDDTFWPVYETVLRAQTEAEKRVEAGMTGAEVDAIARDIISAAGHEEHFGHSLGHGVGLAVHEHPRLGPEAADIIEDGMMFTIEPGIYIPGWGGVRIEDVVAMENGRARVISKAPKLTGPA